MLQFDEAISSTVRTDGKLPQPKASPATGPLSAEQLENMQRYWSAANYLTIGQIYLKDNPLLREQAQGLIAECNNLIARATTYSREHLEDQPEIANWVWI